MSISANFHCDDREPARAEAKRTEDSARVVFSTGSTQFNLFLPKHPDAFYAAQAIALAFNSLRKSAQPLAEEAA